MVLTYRDYNIYCDCNDATNIFVIGYGCDIVKMATHHQQTFYQ